MKRVVVTGIGAATPIGDTRDPINRMLLTSNLLSGVVGLRRDQEFVDAGFRSVCSGRVSHLKEWREELIPKGVEEYKETRRFLGKGDTLILALLPAISAVEDAGLDSANGLTEAAVFVGSGGPSTLDQESASNVLREGKPFKSLALSVPATMSSGVSAIIATHLGLRGGAISFTSACATGTHNIGFAYEQIALGKRKVILAGGADDRHVTKAVGFEAMSALYRGDLPPEQASRPWDKDRAGFVDADGGGVLVLEELDHAEARGARIYAEIVGTAYSSDGASMVEPTGEGAIRSMQEAILSAGISSEEVRYVNAHGTSTPKGDVREIEALTEVFMGRRPYVTSTKAQVGHSLGGSGAVEAAFTILMMGAGRVGPQVNLDNLDPEIQQLGWEEYIPVGGSVSVDMEFAISNSFGFGGTNGTLVFRRWED